MKTCATGAPRTARACQVPVHHLRFSPLKTRPPNLVALRPPTPMMAPVAPAGASTAPNIFPGHLKLHSLRLPFLRMRLTVAQECTEPLPLGWSSDTAHHHCRTSIVHRAWQKQPRPASLNPSGGEVERAESVISRASISRMMAETKEAWDRADAEAAAHRQLESDKVHAAQQARRGESQAASYRLDKEWR